MDCSAGCRGTGRVAATGSGGDQAAASKIRHANVRLAVDESVDGPGLPNVRVAATLRVDVRSIESLCRRFVEEILEACLTRKKQDRPSNQQMLDGQKETKWIAVVCGCAPKDRARWTLEPSTDRVVALARR